MKTTSNTFSRWPPRLQIASRSSTVKHIRITTFAAIAHIYLVIPRVSQDANSGGPIGLVSVKAGTEDSDEEKDKDDGNVESEAPEGRVVPELTCGAIADGGQL